MAYLPEISGRDILLLALPPAAVSAEACEVTEAACAAAAAAATAAAGFSAGLGAAAAAAATGTAAEQSDVRSLKLKQVLFLQELYWSTLWLCYLCRNQFKSL